VELDTTASAQAQRAYLKRLTAQMRMEFPPISVVNREGIELARIYYSTSGLVRWIRWIPYVQALLVAALFLVGWWSLRLLRQTEESRLWVAMAKEAAHQLGTPLSSALGWLEILRLRGPETAPQDILRELEQDVARLQGVVMRFSQIGARPQLTPQLVAPVVEKVVSYLQRRLPQNKPIRIELELDQAVIAALNQELFAWAVENVLKNAIESIKQPTGWIRVRLFALGAVARLEIIDSGRGILPGIRHRIFEPGFTTKRRGWGLGLSLARRIVQQYHGGSLYLKESALGRGSTFVIELPLASARKESPRNYRREGSPELSC
ncbi:MAG: HAMP domain-containing histidine kinase, partial [Candidatus Kapabacteria bacterium]|nr:HAMP domain-containing histidine kinase [Candidatus Kapabacteria bacterium]MDW7997379.1 HAMP domain-containing sensor histidine kinase [Bacteroidota bacterium]